MSEQTVQQEKTSCNRCGNCCRQGGPALHTGDRELVISGQLRLEDLIAVRCGELALRPLEETPRPVTEEFLKLKGQGSDWCCRFYDHDLPGCTIYDHRPLACGLLDCTSPDALLAVAGRDLLTRFDLIADNDPLLPLVRQHEEHCACPDLSGLRDRLQQEGNQELSSLTRLVNLDLAVRAKAAREFSLSLDLELFYFGRPLFQLLQPLGIRVTESMQGLVLHES
jgi:Fe-S-cluster containining protein